MTRMHADEVHTDEDLVRRLLAAQFPQWADLPIARVASDGTDNAIYRIGDEIAARLPRAVASAGERVEKEWRWLPRLAPHLPVAVAAPLAKGTPGEGYPWEWLVSPWLPGDHPTPEDSADLPQIARDLARFLLALERIDATDGPRPSRANFFRGVPLAMRDGATRDAIAKLGDLVDESAVLDVWERALAAPAYAGDGVWVHGDLHPMNMLVAGGRLAGIIDFGGLGVGDPACELHCAWTLFSGESRASFRDALGFDDAAWERGRGWALSWALIVLPYYMHSNPGIVARARHTLARSLEDPEL